LNIWLILWGVLALSLLGFLVWTLVILMRQKRAWSLYAEKRKLRYKSTSFMDVPEIKGVLGEHGINVFESEHVTPDARSVRKLTAIEVNLNSDMPIDGGIASGGLIPIMETLNFKQEYVPKFKAWKKSYVARADSKSVLEAYLSDERLKALCELMKIKNSWIILVFKEDAMLLRIDIADPLHSPKRLDALVKKMLKAAQALELKSGESKRLKAASVKEDSKNVALELDDDVLDSSGLTLEGDDENAIDDKDVIDEVNSSDGDASKD